MAVSGAVKETKKLDGDKYLWIISEDKVKYDNISVTNMHTCTQSHVNVCTHSEGQELLGQKITGKFFMFI